VLTPAELERLQIPFEADRAIREAARKAIRGAANDRQKLAGIQEYFRQEGFAERHVPGLTQTAAETLQSGRGDCQSYASLFIAMARSVGLNAYYLDASDIENEFNRQGRDLIKVGHILVGIRIGPDLLAVDFNGRMKSPKRYRQMTDRQALADFYNNIGYLNAWEHRLSGGMASAPAVRAFEMATRIAPEFSRAWNNLGVALARQGKDSQAERAYRRAIRSEPNFAAAWANLGHLLLRTDRKKRAVPAFERAVRLQPDNPHYQLFLSRILFQAGELDRAQQHLDEALSLDASQYAAHLLQARIHLARDRHQAALRSAQKVLQLVPGQRDASLLVQRLDPSRKHLDSGL
jgi:Tfp pilus assembly protein PilF